MTINKYQKLIEKTAIFPKDQGVVYTTLGLVGESGEIAEKMKKIIRDNNNIMSDEQKLEIIKELGDVQWYITALAKELGFTLKDVMKLNYEKLISRKKRGVIKGNGDNR